MRRIVGFALLLFLFLYWGGNRNLFAQDANDPAQPDTVSYVGAGAHSGNYLYFMGPGPTYDVFIDMCIWTDNPVYAVS